MRNLTKNELKTVFMYLGWWIIDDEEYPPAYEGDTWQRLKISHEWDANNPKSGMYVSLSSLETENVIAELEKYIQKCGTGQKAEFHERNEAQIRLTMHVLKTTAELDNFSEDVRQRVLKAGFVTAAFDEDGKTAYESLRNEKISADAPLLVFFGEEEDVFEWYDPNPHVEDEMHEIRCTAVSLKDSKTLEQVACEIKKHRDDIEATTVLYQAGIEAAPEWIEDNDERCRISEMAEYCDEAEHQLPMLDNLIAALENSGGES